MQQGMVRFPGKSNRGVSHSSLPTVTWGQGEVDIGPILQEMAGSSSVFIVGVSMTPFVRAAQATPTYVQLGRQAIEEVFEDSGLSPRAVDGVVASYNYGDPVCGHRVALEGGIENVPIYNINGYCSAGSAAINLARKLVLSGEHHCVLVVGFDQMDRGLTTKWDERPSTVELHVDKMRRLGVDASPVRPGMGDFTSHVIKMFAYAAREYLEKYPKTPKDIFARIAHKNRVQGAFNPRALLARAPVPSGPEGMGAHPLLEPIAAEMAAPTASGAAAALVVSAQWLRRSASRRTEARAVELLAQAAVTDRQDTFRNASFMDLVGVGYARDAAQRCFQASGLAPRDVDLVELHDCFSANELFVLEALGFAKPGEGSQLVENGCWQSTAGGGRQLRLGGPNGVVVNPSGGLESKGHPIGATGIAQCAEITWQLRNEAGRRQVPGARIALQHNFGLGSTCVVGLYRGPPARPRL